MDVKQLRTFLTIAETGSITRAADLLHVVQPALSRQLRLLEEDLGTPLFERGRRGMQLTEAGQILADRARRALQELDQARAEIIAPADTVAGQVAIGLLPSITDLLAGSLVSALKRQHPRLSVRISSGFAGYQQKWLEEGEIDVALLYEPKPSAVLELHPLFDETLYLVGPPGAGLRLDQPVRVRDMVAMPLVMPSQPHGSRLLLDEASAVAGVQLSITAETNAMNIQRALVDHGVGFTILPGVAIYDAIRQGLLSAAPITAPDLRRRIVMALSRTRPASSAVRCAAAELRVQVRRIIAQQGWQGARWLGNG